MILGRLGNVYFALGQLDEAEEHLTQGLAMARDEENSGLVAALLNDLGNVLAARNKNSEAIGAYTEASILAESTGNSSLAVRTLINAALASIQEGSYQDAKERFDLASNTMESSEPSHDNAYALLSMGLGYVELRSHLPDQDADLIQKAAESFQRAGGMAEQIGDAGAESYAWGFLGHLYEQEGRFEDGLKLTRRAVLASQRVKAPESQYRWEWQTARLLKALGKPEEALMAYRRAVYTLQPIRNELSRGFQGRERPFRESVGPMFFELADILLEQAEAASSAQKNEEYLLQARDTIEGFKAAELQDYFRDDCVESAQTRITTLDKVSQTTAIIYPIIFPDRLEILFSLSGIIKRVGVPVNRNRLNQEIIAYRKMLEKRTTRQYLPHAQKLYDVLIRPLEPYFDQYQIKTLVFVPDGLLRTVPMGPLHDGKHFLIEKYALATTPGLTLTDPQPIDRKQIKLLSVGITEAVQGLPAPAQCGKRSSGDQRTLWRYGPVEQNLSRV